MTRLISLIILVCAIAATHAATFTDVTIEGTPYLTTNVLMQLELSALSRGLDPDADPYSFSNSGEPANEQIHGSGIVFVTVGDRANQLYGPGSGVYHYVERFRAMRHMCNNAWRIWIPDLPGTSFEDWAGLFHTNQTAWFVAAGLSANGWRNATNYNPAVNNWRNFNDPMYIYRTNAAGYSPDIHAGDILGPWIIDDLQLAMDYMQHQARTPRYDGKYDTPMEWGDTTNGISVNYYLGAKAPSDYDYTFNYSDYYPSNTIGKAEALADYSGLPGGSTPFSSERIRAYSRLYFSDYSRWWSSFGLLNYTGYRVDFGHVQTNSALYFFGGQVSAYLRADVDYGEYHIQFDDFGYNVESNKFTEIGRVSILAGTITNSILSAAAFGDPSTVPAWHDDDPVDGSSLEESTSWWRGFLTDNYYKIYSPNHPYTRAP